MKNTLRNNRGFTLVELLAVIVILGIIAAIAVPSIGTIIKNSRVDAVIADAEQFLNAAELYGASHEVKNDQWLSIYADSLNGNDHDGTGKFESISEYITINDYDLWDGGVNQEMVYVQSDSDGKVTYRFSGEVKSSEFGTGIKFVFASMEDLIQAAETNESVSSYSFDGKTAYITIN